MVRNDHVPGCVEYAFRGGTEGGPGRRVGMVFDLTPKVVNDLHGVARALFDKLPVGQTG